MADLKGYIRPPRKDVAEVGAKNILRNLERAQGMDTANHGYLDAQHRMLAIYLERG